MILALILLFNWVPGNEAVDHSRDPLFRVLEDFTCPDFNAFDCSLIFLNMKLIQSHIVNISDPQSFGSLMFAKHNHWAVKGVHFLEYLTVRYSPSEDGYLLLNVDTTFGLYYGFLHYKGMKFTLERNKFIAEDRNHAALGILQRYFPKDKSKSDELLDFDSQTNPAQM